MVSPSATEYEALVKKIQDLLEDGQGETIYEIGVDGWLDFCFSAMIYKLC